MEDSVPAVGGYITVMTINTRERKGRGGEGRKAG